MPTDCPCPCHRSELKAVALAEKMLDVAESAGVDLRALELHRRQFVRDIAACDALVDQTDLLARRAVELNASIELEVDVLARAFTRLRSIVEEVEHAPS